MTAERKYVSILRADLHRSSDLVAGLPLEESIARLEPALEQMRSAVHQHGGIIHREMGDGVFAIFGAPVAEDLHAVMACLAALDLIKRIEKLDDPLIHVRIGLHSGLVFARPRQLDYNESYDFDGPPLILAERLQASALPGQALASEACRVLANGYLHFGPAKMLALKGFTDPVAAYDLQKVGELSRWRVNLARGVSAFVGREIESASIIALVQETGTKGKGAVVSVCGEPGVGKSRLVREISSLLHQRGWQVLIAECDSLVGYAPFSLLKSVLSAAMKEWDKAAKEAVLTRLSPAQRAALEVLTNVATESIIWSKLTARSRGRAIIELAATILRERIDQQPTLLLIEDMQWIDAASSPALEAITSVTEYSPLLFIATARTGGNPSWLDQKASVSLRLAPLELEAGRTMLNDLLGPSKQLDKLKARILTHTGAMPLFIEEVCRGLAEEGKLLGSRGNYVLGADEADLTVPLTVQGMIASRIDRLSRSEKKLLQIAAAVGSQVPSRLLHAISGLGVKAFENVLQVLLDNGFLFAVPQALNEAHSFPHECVRQVAYDAVPVAEKVTLHKRILAELELAARSEEVSEELSTAIVHHAIKAGDWALSAEYADRIARRCLLQSALPDALRYFETAIEAVDRMPPSTSREVKAIDLRIESRLAYANLGKLDRWLTLAKEAEARAQVAGDQLRRLAALAIRAAALVFCGVPIEAIEAGEEAVREAERRGEPGWLGYAEYGLGQARYLAGHYREAIASLQRAYGIFNAKDAPAPLGGSSSQTALLACMMICNIQAALGDHKAAAEAQARADAIAAREGGPMSAIAAAFSRGTLLLYANKLREAEIELSTALNSARAHEVNLFIPVLAHQYGLVLLRLGAGEAARDALQVAKDHSAQLGHRSIELRAEIALGLCAVSDENSRGAAIDSVTRCELIARQNGFKVIEMEAMLTKASLLRAQGSSRWSEIELAANNIAEATGVAGLHAELARVVEQRLESSMSKARHGQLK